MRVYISGKITGLPKEEYRAHFSGVAKRLRNRGFEVVDPSAHDNDLDYAGYMKVSLCLLDMCDAVCMLDGWEDSKGAVFEAQYAVEVLRIPVFGEGNIDEF